jgi:uncharacterized membrane protein YfcA
MTVAAVVLVLALVQSMFGVGLLLFGTPALLLLGFSFRDALWNLLPASLAISALQLATAGTPDYRLVRKVVLWSLPAMCGGLWLSFTGSLSIKIDLLVAALLLLAAYFRHAPARVSPLKSYMVRHEHLTLAVIGGVHGLTNMGGSLLSMYAAARYDDRFRITTSIALGYGLFASSQLVLLFATSAKGEAAINWVSPAVAVTAYLLAGGTALRSIDPGSYHRAFSCFMVACAALLTAKAIA